jgi:hypothetical protein
MYDFGQLSLATVFRAHTGAALSSCGKFNQPHRRRTSRPFLRHASHFQPAWLEN